MIAAAAFEAVLLAAIAALHVAWGFGAVWPCVGEAALVTVVVGYRSERMPPPVQCFIAAGAILAAAVVIALLAGLVRSPLPSSLVVLLGLGATMVFAGRGVAGYVPAWRARFPRQPFARLDRSVYSPLCLVIALTCARLTLVRLG
ncbi:MAG: DUF3995 domain-containing protein [Xanthobacteraceae bacterium]|nr:DUF3995 domain-containing protein [Xanthobacteraceae bacterium]